MKDVIQGHPSEDHFTVNINSKMKSDAKPKTEQKTGILITYDVDMSKMSRAELTRFQRELYGWTDHSNRGKYRYDRPGILTRIPHINPSRSLLMVQKEHAGAVLTHLERYEVRAFAREVLLEGGDVEVFEGFRNK